MELETQDDRLQDQCDSLTEVAEVLSALAWLASVRGSLLFTHDANGHVLVTAAARSGNGKWIAATSVSIERAASSLIAKGLNPFVTDPGKNAGMADGGYAVIGPEGHAFLTEIETITQAAQQQPDPTMRAALVDSLLDEAKQRRAARPASSAIIEDES